MPTSKFDIDVLSSNIKLLIRKKNIKQARLAKELNLEGPGLSKRMKGNPMFSIDEIFTIAQFFNVSIDALCNNSLAETIPDNTNDKDHSRDGKLLLHSDAAIYKVCEGLAAVFKYTSCLMTETTSYTESVYEEEIDQQGRPTGWFYPKKIKSDKNPIGENPTNKYPSIFFSNYWPVFSGRFEPEDDPDDYYEDLIHTGNYNLANYKINRFLKKLVDLHTTYDKGSIKYEDYCQAIDNLLNELPKSSMQKATVDSSNMPEYQFDNK